MTVNKDNLAQRWKTASDFYQDRDNRTMLEVEDLACYTSRPVEIHIDPSEAHTSTVQQITLLVCNLTSRWARRVRIIMPLGVRLIEQLRRDRFEFLEQRIIAEMQSSDPFGDFQTIAPKNTKKEMSCETPLRLFIGSWNALSANSVDFTADDFIVNAQGWTVCGRRGSNNLTSDFINQTKALTATAGLAAAIGVADLFKRAINHSPENWIPTFAWDIWTHSYTNELPVRTENHLFSHSINLGRTLLAGVGAIGSALVYLLDMNDLSGHLTLLDRDRVELSNLNRSPLFNVFHVLSEEYKTTIAAQYLNHHNLDLRVINGTWHENGAKLTQEHYDVWISFTNEDGAWAEVPFQLPPIVVHGTTTSGWGFSAGRHIPRRDDCTLCRMPRPEAVFRGPCAEGEIESEVEITLVRASLPFLSAASASLVLGELIKLNSKAILQLPNDVSADLKTGLATVVSLFRAANHGCRGCRATRSKLWERRGGLSRYSHYSNLD
ncbi:MAG TPA: ThiF family adenylyltransferase [Pyrinomonadaceae bacterium]